MTRGHWIAALFVGIVLPGSSWIFDSGALAWTMFSGSATYRMRLEITGSDGSQHLINPTALAEYTSPDVATYLSGAESWRHGSVGDAFRVQLASLCVVACQLPGPPRHAELQLETRGNLDSDVHVSRAACDCDSAQKSNGR